MLRKFAVCFAIGACALGLTLGSQAADEKKKEKVPTIKEIMKKVPQKMGLVAKTAAAAKAGKWDEAQKMGTELKALGEALGKNKPKKGDMESWEKLTKGFSETMTEIADAAEKKDAAAVGDAAKKFGSSCKTCHDSHK